MVQPVRFGIVGCGVIGNRHLAAAGHSPDVDVVAVADIDRDAVSRARAEFRSPRPIPRPPNCLPIHTWRS